MFSNISWGTFLVVTALVTSVYYVVIVLRFYRRELVGLVKKQPAVHKTITDGIAVQEPVEKTDEAGLSGAPAILTDTNFQQQADDTIDEVEQVVSRIKESIRESAEKYHVRDEFLYRLGSILQSYPSLRQSPYRPAIEELILTECEKYGFPPPDDEDMVRLWAAQETGLPGLTQ